MHISNYQFDAPDNGEGGRMNDIHGGSHRGPSEISILEEQGRRFSEMSTLEGSRRSSEVSIHGEGGRLNDGLGPRRRNSDCSQLSQNIEEDVRRLSEIGPGQGQGQVPSRRPTGEFSEVLSQLEREGSGGRLNEMQSLGPFRR
jgi:hypothetical protein